MKKSEWLPKGTKFMKGTSTETLEWMHKKEKKHVPRKRLKAAILRRQGLDVYEIADQTSIKYPTARDTLRRFEERGLEARYDAQRSGKPSKLTPKEYKAAKKAFYSAPMKSSIFSGSWMPSLAAAYVRREFNKELSVSATARLMIKMGLKCYKPQKVHHKGASPEEIKKFKKKHCRKTKKYLADGRAIVSIDEARCETISHIGYGWFPVGSEPKIETGFGKGKCSIIGANVYDRKIDKFIKRFYPAANSKTYIKMVRLLHKMLGRFVLYADNATYHKSKKKVMEEIAKYGDDIVLEFHDPYTPQENPTEMEFREIKRHSSNMYFENEDEFKKFVNNAYRTGAIRPIRMPWYLTGGRRK